MPPGFYFVKSNTANGSYKYSVPTGFAKYQRASSVGPPSTSYSSSHTWMPPSTYNAYRRPPYSPSSSDSTRSNGTYSSSSSNGGAFSRSSYSRASMPREFSRASMPRELPARGYRAFSREPSPAPGSWRTGRSAVDTAVPSTGSSDYRSSSSSVQNRSEITRVDSVRTSRRDRFER